jgi:hypothetical protein
MIDKEDMIKYNTGVNFNVDQYRRVIHNRMPDEHPYIGKTIRPKGRHWDSETILRVDTEFIDGDAITVAVTDRMLKTFPNINNRIVIGSYNPNNEKILDQIAEFYASFEIV